MTNSTWGRHKIARSRGNAVIEFTLVGIPIIFVLISIFEISRGMWVYHTLAYAAKSGTRYASVHGRNCEEEPNLCWTRVSDVARVIERAGTGLVTGEVTVRFSMGVDTTSDITCTLSNCLTNTSQWPNDRIDNSAAPPTYFGGNNVGNPITISLTTPFRSALSFFWPGSRGLTFGTMMLSASSTDTMRF